MPLSASASIKVTQLSQTSYRYTITLEDTGTTPITTFWFAWHPGQSYLPELPSFSAPAQWSGQITSEAPPPDGFSIQWTASSAASALQPGQSLGGFVFTSSDTPAVVFQGSTIYPGVPVATSAVFSGPPLSDPSFTLVATEAPPVVASVSITSGISIRSEGNAGTTPFTFTLTRTGDTSVAHSVKYAVTPAAVFPVDATDFAGHVLPFGTVTLNAGETTQTLTIDIAGDTDLEASENFVVTLSSPSPGLAIDTASVTGKILNDDTAPPVSTIDDAYIVIEGHALTVGSEAGVLVNDQGGPSLIATLVGGPGHGDMALAADGSFAYTPDPGFAGIDSFTYRASNLNGLAQEQGLLYVVPVNTGASTTLDLLGLGAAEQIAATYVAFFGRAPDAVGHAFWVGQFNAGLATQGPAVLFANIASSFGISAEAKALYPFLAGPGAASDAQIGSFLDQVYNNMFNRSSDAPGLAYWTGQIKTTLAAGAFVGSVLVDIISGTQNSLAGQDITTLMGKVAVSLDYVAEQHRLGTSWTAADDGASATALLHGVTSAPQTVLTGIVQSHAIVLADV